MAPPILWADFPIQWILPVVLLVIWALNQVFGREEARPVPPGRREPLGPRPGAPNRAPRPLVRQEPGREPAPRWPELEPELEPKRRELAPRSPRRPNDEEEIFLIPAEPAGPARNRQAGGPGRRPPRSRTGGSAVPRGASVAQSIGSTRSLGTSLAQAELSSTLGQLGAPNLDESPSRALGSALEPRRAEATVSLVNRSSEELRRAIVLGEVLGRPLAMRKPGR